MLRRWLLCSRVAAQLPLPLAGRLICPMGALSSDMAINSDGSGDREEGSGAPSRKEMEKGVLGA